MNKQALAMLALAAGLAGTAGLAQEPAAGPLYRFDPALSLANPHPPALAAEPPLIVKKDEEAASVRLQTDTPLAPYLGAQRGPELSPEEARLLQERKERGELPDYRLEAGVGLFVEDQASLNLGYRFHEPPSLLNERSTDPLTLSGDLRISFDLKMPF